MDDEDTRLACNRAVIREPRAEPRGWVGHRCNMCNRGPTNWSTRLKPRARCDLAASSANIFTADGGGVIIGIAARAFREVEFS